MTDDLATGAHRDAHTIHVTGWEDSAELELRCDSGPEAPCHWITDDDGGNPKLVEYCNACEWWANCDPEELIHGRLTGPPPWRVEIIWDDCPEIRQIQDGDDLGQGSGGAS